jgi:RES domain.
MESLFSKLTVIDLKRDVFRNIVSLRKSQDLFDDLTDNPADWGIAQRVEDDVKPSTYRSHVPVIYRPFEESEWFNAIGWPFRYWSASRFSDGSFGVWYGSDSVETTVYETAYHWYTGLLADAGFQHERVIAERKVYTVACQAAMLDFRRLTPEYPDLLHPTDYSQAQRVGARIHHEGHPGLLIQSARHAEGENVAVFNPGVLANPRMKCNLSYRLEDGRIIVQKQPGRTFMRVDTARFT